MKPQFLVLVTLFFNLVYCQTNIGNNVADGLLNCYNNSALPGVTIPNDRPPASMNIFIEYVRRLEDGNPTMSPQQVSLQILQRLRQDGISRTERTVDTRFGVPFSSSRLERYKFRVLLRDLLPNVEQAFSNGDLTNFERCSLHYMISNTIDDLRRDNEATECSRSSRYTLRVVNRRRRDVGEGGEGEGEETLDNTELISQDSGLGVLSANVARNMSQCPIELGVVYSPFGTIKAGNVLAGISAGFNQQNIQGGLVDNRFSATIIGELCEASLFQASQNVTLGSAGGWNSTINPRYFFLQNNNLLQATDAELRGALDGLYMALRMTSLTSTFSDLKVSQLLDMYYSPYERGIFDRSFRACNRAALYSQTTNSATMRTQLLNFMPILNSAAISGVSLNNASFEIFSNAGMQAFEAYLPRMAAADLSCQGVTSIERVASDVLIFIDSGWQFNTVQLVLSYILDNIDVNRFQTRYTLYGGSSLRNLTTLTTNSLSEYFIQYNQTVHVNETSGFDYVRIFEAVETYGRQKLNNNSFSGGESTIVLLVTRTGITDEQNSFLVQRREIFNTQLPDINFLVLGSGNANDFTNIVTNTNRDVVILQDTINEETLKTLGQQVVNSIKEVPRAVVNPTCTAQYTGPTSTFTLTQYVEPMGTNHYRISPNYFHTGGDVRNLRIREQGAGTINVCVSRDTIRPDNSSNTCRNISSAEYFIEITSYCDGFSITACPPIFLSITGGNSSIRCNDNMCRFPDEIPFSITMENVGCASSSVIVAASAILVLLICAFSKLL